MAKYDYMVNDIKASLTLEGKQNLLLKYKDFCNKLNLKENNYRNLEKFFTCWWNVSQDNIIFNVGRLVNEYIFLTEYAPNIRVSKSKRVRINYDKD